MNYSLFRKSDGEISAKSNRIILLIFLTSLLFLLIVLFLSFTRKNPTLGHNFSNLAINPLECRLKIYDGLENIDSIAAVYTRKGMPGFYPDKIWETSDTNLIPVVHYPFGIYHNPVTIAHTAQAFYASYLKTGHASDKTKFLSNVAWLMKNHQDYYFRYEFGFEHNPKAILKKGWISAMAQGEGLAALCLAYTATGDAKYRDFAKHLFSTLYTNTDSLWCFGIDEKGYYWLEEYPTPDFCHVLNGMLYALWGIWDYYVITHDKFALTLFKAGLRTIADNYKSWKTKNHRLTFYCWHKHINANYHKVHLMQLQKYVDIFNIPEFRDALNYYAKDDTNHSSQ